MRKIFALLTLIVVSVCGGIARADNCESFGNNGGMPPGIQDLNPSYVNRAGTNQLNSYYNPVSPCTQVEYSGGYYNWDTNTWISVYSCTSCISGYDSLPTSKTESGCVIEYTECGMTCNTQSSKPSGSNANTVSVHNCASSSTTYAVISGVSGIYWTINTCNTCSSGYYPVSRVYSIAGMPAGDCDVGYTDCVRCVYDDHCGTSDTSFVASTTGYQKKTSYSCSNNSCYSSTQYRCAKDYYPTQSTTTGIATSTSALGCTKCGNMYSTITTTTTGPGATGISACCAASGSTASDTTGTFQLQGSCCWQ